MTRSRGIANRAGDRQTLDARFAPARAALSLLMVMVGVWGSLSAAQRSARTYTIPLPPKPDFSTLDWLIGDWAGKTTGNNPNGDVHLSVSYTLDGRFMAFHEQVALPATKTLPASRETWTGFLSADRGASGFTLHVFSSTGFITRYHVTFEQTELRCNPEGGDDPPHGWLFRRVIKRGTDSNLFENVQVAPPDRNFFDYYVARLTRSKPVKEPSH